MSLVFLVHLGRSFPQATRLWSLPFVNAGWTGVDLFFVLSGYLIGTQLWKQLRRAGHINVRDFIIRRGFRIWPLYFAFVAMLGVSALVRGSSLLPLLSDVFFVSNYLPHFMSGGWSLSIEEQFYIVTPLALLLASRRMRLARLWVIPAAWLVALPLIRSFVSPAPAFANSEVASGIYTPFYTHSDGLAAGLLLAWIATVRREWLRKQARFVWASFGAAIVSAFLLRNGVSHHVFGFSALALIYGAAAYAALSLPTPRWMRWHGFYVISRLSYGVYLNHFIVLAVLVSLGESLFGRGDVAAVLCGVVGYPIALIAAFATFSIVELPFLRIREGWMAPASLGPTPVTVPQLGGMTSDSIGCGP